MSRPVVIKVGGSLFDWPQLPARLSLLLDEQRVIGRHPVVLAGGGPAADFIRSLDRTFALGDLASHHLALRALDLTAHALAALLPGLDVVVVDEIAALAPVWNRGGLPVLAPRRFLEALDLRDPHPLPASWDVTSDSIAARVAVHLGAAELVLLKSASLPAGADRLAAARLGLVDARFPHESGDLERVVYVNLRLASTLTSEERPGQNPGSAELWHSWRLPMPQTLLIPLDRPEVPAKPISTRLRAQLVYFMTAPGTPGIPALGEEEYWFAADDVARWIDEGVFYLVSPLDTANMTEVEITEEQEAFLQWLRDQRVQHVRVQEGDPGR
jgi:aspartokinase-like uncharacterized kinase